MYISYLNFAKHVSIVAIYASKRASTSGDSSKRSTFNHGLSPNESLKTRAKRTFLFNFYSIPFY